MRRFCRTRLMSPDKYNTEKCFDASIAVVGAVVAEKHHDEIQLLRSLMIAAVGTAGALQNLVLLLRGQNLFDGEVSTCRVSMFSCPFLPFWTCYPLMQCNLHACSDGRMETSLLRAKTGCFWCFNEHKRKFFEPTVSFLRT